MKVITEAFIRYNANANDRDTGDCVVRSLSLAFDMDYKKVASELRKIRRDNNLRSWKTLSTYSKFVAKYNGGNSEFAKYEEGVTVAEFCETHPTGTFLVICGPTNERSNHIVCVIDGDLYDSWDSSHYYTNKVCIVSQDISGIEKRSDDFYKNLKEYAKYTIKNEIDRTMVPLGKLVNVETVWSTDLIKAYVIVSAPSAGTQQYSFNIIYKISPKNTEEQCQTIIDKMTKNHIKKHTKILQQMKYGYEFSKDYEDKYNGSEYDVLEKLPYWCRKLIVDIEDRGPYCRDFCDRYRVEMQALKDDPRLDMSDEYNVKHQDEFAEVVFYASTIGELVKDMEYYKKTYNRFGYDY